MSHDLAGATASLYEFLVESEAPLAARASTFSAARQRVTDGVQRLAARLSEVRARAAALPITQRLDDALARLSELAQELRQHAPAPERLRGLWKSLGTSYEALRVQVTTKDGGALQALKPKNLARAAFHVSMALSGVILYELVLGRVGSIIATGVLFALFVALEIIRRRSHAWNRHFTDKMFKAIIRPGEVHRVPAATWYVAALFLGCLLYPKEAIQVGALVLGFGDPLANLIGRRFGRTKLVGDKSVVGTLAFVVGSAVVAFAFLLMLGFGGGQALVVALVAAVAGAAAELFSGRLDDNFTIPLVAGLAVIPLL